MFLLKTLFPPVAEMSDDARQDLGDTLNGIFEDIANAENAPFSGADRDDALANMLLIARTIMGNHTIRARIPQQYAEQLSDILAQSEEST